MTSPTDTTTVRNHSEPLSVIQRWFSAVVTHPDGVEGGVASDEAQALAPLGRDELERIITRSEKLSANQRLSIYANAYYARLIECLGDSFPVLKIALGEGVFNGFVFGYLQRYPSRSYTLNQLGRHFARYLDETRPDREAPDSADSTATIGWPDFLIDLVNLEWTVEQVFDGPGAEGKATLQADLLLEVPPDRWPEVRLRTVPCLRLMSFRFPVLDYYTAIRSGDETAKDSPPGPADSYVAVTRRDYVVRLRGLSLPQYSLLSGLDRGESVGESVERAAGVCDSQEEMTPEALRRWFGDWSRLELFEGIELPE